MEQSHHRLAGRIGGLTVHARYGSSDIARRARRGLDERFRADVIQSARDLDQGHLSEPEIERRVELRRRIHMTRMTAARQQKRLRREIAA